MIGTRGFLALRLTCSAVPSFQPILELRDSVREVLFKRPTVTSFRCRGSPIQEAISNSTNSMQSFTMIQRWSGNGVTTESLNRSTTEVGKSKSLVQSHRALETVSGLPSSFPISGINRKMLEDKFLLMDSITTRFNFQVALPHSRTSTLIWISPMLRSISIGT